MADNSHIEWTDATWNPITGCSLVSPGCTNCYAMRLAGTRLGSHSSRAGLTRETKAGPVWTGEVRLNEQWLDQPLRWRKPRMIFVCAHGDLFAEGVPDEWIDRAFAVMALAPQHTFQVLTKRSARMREYLSAIDAEFHASPDDLNERFGEHCVKLSGDPCSAGWFEDHVNWPLPNVWLGVSVEDQARAEERIPDLLATPAAIRWISAEPLLGPVDLLGPEHEGPLSNGEPSAEQIANDPTGWRVVRYGVSRVDWVVAGGESGPGARPMHPDWARSLRDQCAAAGVPFFFKQWGAWFPRDQWEDNPELVLPDDDMAANADHPAIRRMDGTILHNVGKAMAGRLLDGVTHDGLPECRL